MAGDDPEEEKHALDSHSIQPGWTDEQRAFLAELSEHVTEGRQHADEFERLAQQAPTQEDAKEVLANAKEARRAAAVMDRARLSLASSMLRGNEVQAARDSAASAREAADAGKRAARWTALAAGAALLTAMATAGATLGWWGPSKLRTDQPSAIQAPAGGQDRSPETPRTAQPEAPAAASSSPSALPAPPPDRSVGSAPEPAPQPNPEPSTPAPPSRPQGDQAVRPADS